jgi:NADPH-dependent F420 reductase
VSKTADIVAVIGGTGKLGAALARRLATNGRMVVIGSRDPERSAEKARELGHGIVGMGNAEAAAAGTIIVVTVPFAAQDETLRDIKDAATGKIVVDTTVPLVPPKVMRVQLPAEGSAAQRAQALLGEETTVTSALHNVAAHKLAKDEDVGCDVLVFGDQKEARAQVIALVSDAGLRAIHGGALANSAAAEAMTSVLIFVNKTYQVDGAGIRLTGELLDPE